MNKDYITPQRPEDLPVIQLTDNARTVLEKRYLRRGESGETVETIDEMFWRVAWHIAGAEPGAQKELAPEFYKMLVSKQFFPNSPTFTGAGTPLGQLAACFVLPIADDMGKHADGIFQTLRNAALIQQTGGGNGFSFSRLRQKGAYVKSSGGTSTGPIGFMKVFDQAFGMVAQGGTRRGANMAVLRVDHPDIYEFIQCKSNESQITNFNISVGITDKFMEAVRDNKPFDLIAPHTGLTVKTVDARELFDLVVKYAHHNGEPGCLFLDAANRQNPVPHLYELEATNPCGEQWLGPYENCCLGSINLSQHLGPNNDVDWELLEKTIRTSTRFLDDVVTVNAYVPDVPQLKEAAFRCRRIGLGIMGLSDLMYHCGIRYGSEEGQEFAAQVMEFVRYHSMLMSIELSQERGPFPAIEGSIYDSKNFVWKAPQPLVPYKRDYKRPSIDWASLTNDLKTHGIRNAAQTTVAPTGTIATVAGCEGYGCEPVFALGYVRHVNDNGKDLKLTYASPFFIKALENAGFDEATRTRLIDRVMEGGSCQHVIELPLHIRNTFVVSSDISADEHVRMQAAMQAFVDNSMSKTCNLPEGATVDDVARAYMLSWQLGCKGLTVYVTGSRQVVVLETKKEAAKKDKKEDETVATAAASSSSSASRPVTPKKDSSSPTRLSPTNLASGALASPIAKNRSQATTPIGRSSTKFAASTKKNSSSSSSDEEIDDEEPLPKTPGGTSIRLYPTGKMARPQLLEGCTHMINTPVGKAFVTINEYERQPFETFINTAKAGSEIAAISEAMGRLISYVLRVASPVTPLDRLTEVATQLEGIGGRRSQGFGRNRICSLPDGIAKGISLYLERNERLYKEASELESSIDLSSYATVGGITAEPATPSGRFRIGDICPDCGEPALVNEEGCRKCYSCAYSEC
eukprot:TRINITY_DN2765_c0_g1_i2.p1 TRINITY_DN2765_c0_g1~~TRINITY_DN2765_c0_g1_i2.p1  ORF type:complete len:915 (+),score=493.49 TRINITY_DN2765_c0_g1_i2:143-2887(+)